VVVGGLVCRAEGAAETPKGVNKIFRLHLRTIESTGFRNREITRVFSLPKSIFALSPDDMRRIQK
jgi:hypothetical protein